MTVVRIHDRWESSSISPVTHGILLGRAASFGITAFKDDARPVAHVSAIYGETLISVHLTTHTYMRTKGMHTAGRQAGAAVASRGTGRDVGGGCSTTCIDSRLDNF